MKFTNGYWLMRPGIAPAYMQSIYDVEQAGQKVTMHAGTVPVPPDGNTRGILDGVMLTLELTAPMDDVIGVRVTHWKGKKKAAPEYQLFCAPANVAFTQMEDAYCYTSGSLSVCFNKVPSRCEEIAKIMYDQELLTKIPHGGMAYMKDENTGKRYLRQEMDLDVGECLYGLGERFTPFVKNGQVVDMWMADGGTGSEQAYKNVPFYLSSHGYGVFVNSSSDVSFELASEKVMRACFSAEEESLQYFIIGGKTLKAILSNYTKLTGRPALPPAWSFGLWLSTSFTTDYDEKTVTGMLAGMREREIPLSVFHFDCFWMKGHHWTDFCWDADMFPDPAGMLKRYKEQGLHISVWINPYIAQQSALFDECVEKGYLIKKTNGDVWQTDLWQSGMGIVDFTNPEACAWYQSKLHALMDMGVDCFKTDFGERIPVRDIQYYDGSDPVGMHNYYTLLYNQTVFEAIESKRGKGEAVLFARSGTAGGQQYPLHWGGDNSANYPSMAETLRAGLSLAVSGYGFWSHDIGGFEATATADVYKRWCAFGLLSSHSRLHGSSSYRVPWNFDAEASEVLRHFAQLKNSLMPYIYGCAVEAHTRGIPVIRPMILEFQHDPACLYLDQQYMLGQNLMVAPVFNTQGKVTFYVPEGVWTDYQSGKTYDGGRFYTEYYDYFGLPLLVRPNTLLPVGANVNRPDYAYTENLTVKLFQPEEDVETVLEIPSTDGSIAATVRVTRKGESLIVKTTGNLPGLKLNYNDKLYAINDAETCINTDAQK